MLLTVFTPTYNRAYIIGKLYESLCHQTCQDFEWLVVDDGSTDNTEQLIADFIAEHRVRIRYIKKENGGKHTAINFGAKEARGELFFIVDSDDYLTEDAVDWVITSAKDVMSDNSFAGISGTRIRPDGSRIGGVSSFKIIDSDAISIRTKYKIKGDLAEIYKTNVLRQYPFPIIESEKFCSEGLIWGRISLKYILRYYNRGIYICEYLSDGLTTSSIKCRLNSPGYSMLAYSEMSKNPHTFLVDRIKCRINFWLYSMTSSISFVDKCKQIGFVGSLFYPVGVVFYLFKKRKIQ